MAKDIIKKYDIIIERILYSNFESKDLKTSPMSGQQHRQEHEQLNKE